MKLSRLYELAVKFGKERDPRKKEEFGSFEDTAVLFGSPDTDVRKIMVGIDIDVGELLLADKIRGSEGLDLVLAHHPQGAAAAHFYEVMRLQVDMLVKAGIEESTAREMIEERRLEVERRVMPQNHMRSTDAATILGLPFMCVHTPADNHVAYFLRKLFDREKPGKVQDILDLLDKIPEYEDARRNNSGPRVILGNPRRSAGRIFLEMTGGTEGNKDIYPNMYKAGVRTLVSMHLSEEHFKRVKDADLNVVIAGHVSSDTLGLNLLLDRIEEEEKLLTIDCSGFRRIRRNKR
ncbi:MAG: NGG1p interacting factor NIF3 [Candidatus Omnitrophica bacterium]|nr:NGG1p interacting factor NIF3 [Candidatus Omnitrophota bacterium]MDD5552980.1 NGG1p interacting factor NIF3 [Candidatus Omnitrophota bacterium]